MGGAYKGVWGTSAGLCAWHRVRRKQPYGDAAEHDAAKMPTGVLLVDGLLVDAAATALRPVIAAVLAAHRAAVSCKCCMRRRHIFLRLHRCHSQQNLTTSVQLGGKTCCSQHQGCCGRPMQLEATDTDRIPCKVWQATHDAQLELQEMWVSSKRCFTTKCRPSYPTPVFGRAQRSSDERG